ncbi:unnamed protein product [Meloidogyne enterolobii]|uniref:Uncharacterized protein n=1 Tax=Meloidogyne enterolobii TaxID=390850 RepID=A0ACB0Y6Z6_MELEN
MNNTNNLLSPIQVVAKYKFEGRNNDELSFSKNDIITVTQQLDGGWYVFCFEFFENLEENWTKIN